MTEQSTDAQVVADECRVKRKPDFTLMRAITMSVVAILAVAVGTIYGTILF
jgi:hypothetical protein